LVSDEKLEVKINKGEHSLVRDVPNAQQPYWKNHIAAFVALPFQPWLTGASKKQQRSLLSLPPPSPLLKYIKYENLTFFIIRARSQRRVATAGEIYIEKSRASFE
jgi:hypothetical protein